ncbi:MAG: hypothetical protein ABH846_02375, partial [Patescibacteria group bacterium]
FLGAPLFYLPLHFIFGIIVMHRVGTTAGFFWFLATGIFINISGFDFISFIAYLAVAVFGIILTKRMFTNRSVYALEGLGASLFLIFSIIGLLSFLFPNQAANNLETFGSYCTVKAMGLFLLITGLYFGFITSRYLKHLSENIFLIKAR